MTNAEKKRRYRARLALRPRPAHDWRVSEQALLHSMVDPSDLLIRPARLIDERRR